MRIVSLEDNLYVVSKYFLKKNKKHISKCRLLIFSKHAKHTITSYDLWRIICEYLFM